MTAKLPAVAAAFLLYAGVAAAQPKPADKALVAKVYDLKPVLGGRGPGGVADADAVVKLILELIALGEPRADGTGPQLVERDGGQLEVRATAKVHNEVRDLLAALARLNDLAFDVAADVYELDAATYAKLLKALPEGREPLLFGSGESEDEMVVAARGKALAEAMKVLGGGRAVQSSKNRIAQGADAPVGTRMTVVPFANFADEKVGAARDNPLFVKEGFRLSAVAVASADRRSVRLKLSDQSAVVTGLRKRELGERDGKAVVAQSPEVEDRGATASVVVADGGAVLFRLAYAPKDKVWVAVLRPTILIAGESEAERKQRLEDKVKRVFPQPKQPGSF